MVSNPIQPAPSSAPAARELDLFSYALLLLGNWRFILGCGLVAFLLMVADMLHTKPRFSSTAVMIVPQGNITSSKLQAQIAMSTSDLLGGGYELYADMLKSRTVGDRLIQDYNLMQVYGVKESAQAEIALAGLTKVETEREGVLRVTVQDTNAQRAADLANDYLHQLDLLNSQLVLSSVGQERLFLERELVKEKDTLADAEVALKQVQVTTGGVSPEAQASAGLSAVESTRAQLRVLQIHRDALLTGETEQNPEVIRTESQIAGLTEQLQALENGGDSASTGLGTAKVTEQGLLFTRRKRDVLFHEELFSLLEKEFEEAKQQEAKTPTIVQVLDPAVPAYHKAWPPRTLYCGLAGLFGIAAGILLVSFQALALAYLHNPANSGKLAQLRALYRKNAS